MGENEKQKKQLHAIMICVPYQGHLNPFVTLALKLASNGISITFVHLEFLYRKLCDQHHAGQTEVDFFAGARKAGLDVRFATIADPFPVEFDRDLHFEEYWDTMITDFAPLVDRFVAGIVESQPEMLHFLVADTIYNWPSEVAEKHKLVNVSFWTQPALVFCLAYHWELLEQNGHIPCKEDMEEEINYIPGVESINTKDLMPYMKDSTNVISRGTRLAFASVKKADFILHNIVQELESQTLSTLQKYQPNYAIGPLNFSKNLPTHTVTTNLWSKSDCTAWLASKPPASVLYVSFGSFVHTDKHVLQEIAYGLALSGATFVWVIREGILSDGDTDVLPVGFRDEVGDRGLVVGWCDQIRVLENPAVGGFLTHNGWNSTVESMWSGVPMICYPIGFDQPCNRKLVVDDWKIGMNLCEGASLDRKEVAQRIKNFFNGERFKEKACKVGEIMKNALENEGSSERNFKKFVKDLEAKIHAQDSES